MTDLDKRARRAWHRAILAVAPDRPLVEPWIGWTRAALAWQRDSQRRRLGRYKAVSEPRPTSVPVVPLGVLVGLRTRGERRAAIRAAVRRAA